MGTWKLLSARIKEQYKVVEGIIDTRKNFANYRAELESAIAISKPYVPYTGLLTQDLTFIEDGNKDVQEEKGVSYVNFVKLRHISGVLRVLRHATQFTFDFLPTPQLQWFYAKKLKDEGMTEDETYKHSYELEPRQSAQK